MSEIEERIVMTPSKKGPGHTTIRMERILPSKLDNTTVMHVAGGDHRGLVINKEIPKLPSPEDTAPELSLEFKVFLTNSSNNLHTQESRQLRFWFKESLSDNEQMRCTQNFFKELVNPSEFPRDYVGFIKKIMKLMQVRYPSIKRIDVDLMQLGEMSEEPPRPNSSLDDSLSRSSLTMSKVLELIESAYPSPISVPEIARTWNCSNEEVEHYILQLESKGLIKCMDNGAYTRVTQNDTEVKLVKQMPKVNNSQQPTIAIITAHFWEKVAVDAMIDNKNTYFKYKREGESNVYTLGNIGPHRVVATKLPAIGHSRSASIAAGSTTTRLLGTFQKVEYVFLVGVGGGVPHYTDATKHVRLGDVVISAPPAGINDNYIYMYCERMKHSPDGPSSSPERYNIKTWSPPNFEIQHVAHQLWIHGCHYPDERIWEHYVNDALETLQGQEGAKFIRPPAHTDKLYMSLGGKDLIEVNHPQATSTEPTACRPENLPALHFGAVGCGRMLMRDDALRLEFANQHGIVAFDTEFDAVVESIYGNRKDNYVFIRGIADYKDGSKKKDWQPHAALCAAAVMKAIILALDPIDDD